MQGTTGWEPVAPTLPSGAAKWPFQTAQTEEKLLCFGSLSHCAEDCILGCPTFWFGLFAVTESEIHVVDEGSVHRRLHGLNHCGRKGSAMGIYRHH